MNRYLDHAARSRIVRLDVAPRGFTLIEVMITVAIISILTAIALPSYRDYVLRGYLVDATNQLSTFQAQMERYYQDNRTYTNTGSGSTATTAPCAVSPAPRLNNFTLSCTTTDGPPQAYVLTSTGSGPVNGFVYTVTSQNIQGTTISGVPGWSSSSSCWIVKKGMTTC